MLESIKNLKPEDKFKAFIIVVLLSTISSITTVYLSTDDCSGLANQYNTLIKNYTETLSINNQLVSDNNQKQKDFMIIKKMLDSLYVIKPEIIKKTTVKEDFETPIIRRNNLLTYQNNDTLVVASAVMEPEIRVVEKNKIIQTETTVTKMGDKQKTILDNVNEVLKKHEKE